MSVVVRPYEKADESGVAKLRTLAFPEWPEAHDADWHPSIYHWFKTPSLAGEVYRWVALDEGKVVGHLAALPQYYRVGGRRVLVHTPGDYMVEFGYGFHALPLMRAFFRTCENYVACNRYQKATKIETSFRASESGELQYAVKAMDVTKYPNLPAAVPAPMVRLLSRGLRVADKALGRASGSELEVEEIKEFDQSFDHLFERVAAVVPCVPEKDAAFLNWRYGPDSPQGPVTVLGVRGEEGMLGYAVLKVSYHVQDGNVLDLMTLPGRRDVARALLWETVFRFRQAGVYIIRYRFVESSTSPSAGDLLRLGFFFLGGRRYALLVKFADGVLHETASDIANWSYSLGDGEASFWVQ